jgi:hypothetical protein
MSERDDLVKSLSEEFVTQSLQGKTLTEVCGFIADAILLVRGLNTRLCAELAAERERCVSIIEADLPVSNRRTAIVAAIRASNAAPSKSAGGDQ